MPSATTYYQTNLDTDITYLKGVGPQRGRALKKYGIENTVRIDLTKPTLKKVNIVSNNIFYDTLSFSILF